METITTDLYGTITAMQVNVQLVQDDGGQYVAYCPALELSSYGDTEVEAQEAFDEALASFTQDVTQRGTLTTLLAALGWQRSPAASGIIYHWIAPTMPVA